MSNPKPLGISVGEDVTSEEVVNDTKFFCEYCGTEVGFGESVCENCATDNS